MKSLETGEKYYSPETGFLHNPPQMIPIFDNLCYAASLFRSRTKENVEKGIELIEKILPFQTAEGFYPLYLHEYPKIQDPFQAIYHLKPLRLIFDEFKNVIPFRNRLEKSILKLADALESAFKEKQPTGFLSYLYKGQEIEASKFYSSSNLGELFCEGRNLDLIPFVWHPFSKTYVGPAFKEKQSGFYPELNGMDLIFNSEREGDSLTYLKSALITQQPEIPPFHPFKKEFSEQGFRWGICQEKSFAFSVLEKKGHEPLYYQPGCQLFRFVESDGGGMAVLEAGCVEKSDFAFTEKGVDLFLTLNSLPLLEDREKNREITFYFDKRMGLPQNETGGTLFKLNEPIHLKNLTLTFSLHKGNGEFIGHKIWENRPSQIIRDQVFDRALSLRTLRREAEVVLRVSICM